MYKMINEHDYKSFSPRSRVWIYQCSREFTGSEHGEILRRGRKFIESWTAHGKLLYASIELFYNRFTVVFADEEKAGTSGCSTDKLLRFVMNLERDYGFSLLNRKLVAYRQGENICSATLEEFKILAEEGNINNRTVVFDNRVNTKCDFEKKWEIPLEKSWLCGELLLRK